MYNKRIFNIIMDCPACKTSVEITYYFCPSCGKQLRDRPLSTSFWQQLKVYIVSFLFPPFGLWSAFRYLTQKGIGTKIIGAIATSLTVIAIIIVTYEILTFSDIINQILPQLMQLSQMNI